MLARETPLKDETVVVTENQKKGRGQRENKWFSKTGESLTFSVYKQFEGLEVDKQFMISMAVSLGVIKAFERFDIPKIAVKWPNDILSDGKKVGAILIENVLEGSRIKYSVIGIGVNVNNLEESFENLPQASSLKLQTQTHFDLDEVMDVILENCFQELRSLSSQSFAMLQKRYESYLFRKEKISVFEDSDGNRFNGIVKGITNLGELLLQTENESALKVQIKQLKMIY